MAAGDAAFQAQDWAAAVESYRKAQAKGIDHGILHFRMGYALHLLGRHEEALASHIRAVSVPNPEIRIDALYNAACACALLGRTDESLEFFAKAIDAGFEDTAQIEKDSDLNSLRDNERFKTLVAGIGKAPRLCEQMDFFLGEWSQKTADGEVVANLSISRPLENSYGLATKSTNQGIVALTGMLWPDSNERVWRWTEVDGLGTVRTAVGKANDDGSMTFTGRDASPADPGVMIRLTFAKEADGRVKETVEVSEDEGKTWRTYHSEAYVRKAAANTEGGAANP